MIWDKNHNWGLTFSDALYNIPNLDTEARWFLVIMGAVDESRQSEGSKD